MTRVCRQVFLATVALLIGSGGACAQESVPQESVIYSFDYFHGGDPEGNLLIDANGNLFGTTSSSGLNGTGTIFELSPVAGGWTKQVLYTFPDNNGNGDGAYVNGTLVTDGKGNLYGTTSAGSLYTGNPDGGDGTVFELSPTAGGHWTEKVIFRFGSYAGDGTNPAGNLVFDTQGRLYGITSNNNGTVYQLTPLPDGTWTEKVLYSFGAPPSGRFPVAGLAIDSNGNLYGTTLTGGLYLGGTLFELVSQKDGTWTENVLHDFNSPQVSGDGSAPISTLILDNKGNLYGTTESGGIEDTGTAFEFSPGPDGTWVEKVFQFGLNPASGTDPEGGLTIDSEGNLYGTTERYIGLNCTGTVFKLTPEPNGSWAETVLHEFSVTGPGYYSTDGYCPFGGVTFDSKGNLYGTTFSGGEGEFNAGTVYEIGTPRTAPAVGTTTTLTVTPDSNLVAGEPITLMATVTAASGAAVPTGTVTFGDPAGAGITVALIAGEAVFSGRVPSPGTYSVFASYSGAAGFAQSSSAVITRTVEAPF